jgi:hypothetical protein
MASPSSSRSNTIVPAPIATADTQHVCFICLQTDADAPNGPWVHACPCSLEAHEKCMLQWIAEMETTPRTSTNSQSSQGLRCPACRARIRVEEPRDAVVAFYNAFQRSYGRISPIVLLTLVSGGTMVGSAWYGWNALSVFAGSPAANRWLGARVMPDQFALTSVVRLAELSLIGPGLVVLWWVPGSVFSMLPGSVLVSFFVRKEVFANIPLLTAYPKVCRIIGRQRRSIHMASITRMGHYFDAYCSCNVRLPVRGIPWTHREAFQPGAPWAPCNGADRGSGPS